MLEDKNGAIISGLFLISVAYIQRDKKPITNQTAKGNENINVSTNGPVSTSIRDDKTERNKGFTLIGGILVKDDYTRIKSINQKGDLSFIGVKGGSATQMTISEKEYNKGGDLNLNRSEINNANENIIKGNVNLLKSSIDNFNKNIVEINSNNSFS